MSDILAALLISITALALTVALIRPRRDVMLGNSVDRRQNCLEQSCMNLANQREVNSDASSGRDSVKNVLVLFSSRPRRHGESATAILLWGWRSLRSDPAHRAGSLAGQPHRRDLPHPRTDRNN